MGTEKSWHVTRDTETGREEVRVPATLCFVLERGVVVEDSEEGVAPTLELGDDDLVVGGLRTIIAAAVQAGEKLDCLGEGKLVETEMSASSPSPMPQNSTLATVESNVA